MAFTKQFACSSGARIHSVPRFKAGMFETICFLSMSRLAFDHKFFDEGFDSNSFNLIFQTKS